MFSKKAAQALDNIAAKSYEAGMKVGGETGGKVAGAVVNATLGPIRGRLDHDCTRPDCQHA